MSYIDQLGKAPIFQGLPCEVLRKLDEGCRRITVPPGRRFIQRGERALELYVIVTGAVSVSRPTNKGEEKFLHSLGPGEVVGEIGVLDDKPRSANVSTEHGCDLLIVQRQALDQAMASSPELSRRLMKVLCRKLRSADKERSSRASVQERLYRLLEELSEGGRRPIEGWTQARLAERIGAQRETVSRAFVQLERQGRIARNGHACRLIS